jgi:hypothetical protein
MHFLYQMPCKHMFLNLYIFHNCMTYYIIIIIIIIITSLLNVYNDTKFRPPLEKIGSPVLARNICNFLYLLFQLLSSSCIWFGC